MGNSHNSAGQLHSESRLAANKCEEFFAMNVYLTFVR